jgi:hypothetical protein
MTASQEAHDAARAAFAKVYNDPATMTACIEAAVDAAEPRIRADERERIRHRLLACRECGYIHGEPGLFAELTAGHDNQAPWIPAGPDAFGFMDALLGDGPVP